MKSENIRSTSFLDITQQSTGRHVGSFIFPFFAQRPIKQVAQRLFLKDETLKNENFIYLDGHRFKLPMAVFNSDCRDLMEAVDRFKSRKWLSSHSPSLDCILNDMRSRFVELYIYLSNQTSPAA